jgi:hypothetical protein
MTLNGDCLATVLGARHRHHASHPESILSIFCVIYLGTAEMGVKTELPGLLFDFRVGRSQ